MSTPRKLRSFPGLLPLALGWLLLAACAPTEGDDGSFVPIETTNEDFDPALYADTGNYPVTMATGDFDGVGATDIAVVNWLAPGANSKDIADDDKVDGSLTLLINSNDGLYNFTSSTGSPIALGKYASTILAGDLDGGVGNDDLAVLVNDPDGPFVWICTNTAADCTGATTVSLSATHNAQAAQMSFADLDNEGAANDLVLTIPAQDEVVAILITLGVVQPIVTTALTEAGGRFAVGNFDADGISDDLAITVTSPAEILIRLGAGAGAFTTGTTVSLEQRPKNIISTDLDGTNNDDLVVTVPLRDEVTVLVNGGAATFTSTDILVGDEPEFLVAGDFNSLNTVIDLVALHNLEQFVTYLDGSAGPTYPTTNNPEYFVTRDPFAAVAGHFTGGAAGDLDLVVVGTDKRAVSVLAGDGAGNFSHTQIGFAETVRFPIAVDLDGVGGSDLILLQPFSDKVVILINP